MKTLAMEEAAAERNVLEEARRKNTCWCGGYKPSGHLFCSVCLDLLPVPHRLAIAGKTGGNPATHYMAARRWLAGPETTIGARHGEKQA